MTDTGIWGEETRWYPEIGALGDTCRAWQAEFDRQHIPLRVRSAQSPNPHRTATVAHGDLHAELLLSPWKRQFRLALRTGRRTLLQGLAADLATATGAASLWVCGASPGVVASAWPFLGSVALAEARERGDRRESSWLSLYENHTANPIGVRLQAFVALAFHQPRLRALMPYTSHWTLHFSSTTEWPYTRKHPVVDPAPTPDRYVIHARDGRRHAETDAADALALVLADLP